MNTWTPDSIASHILFRGALIARAIIALDDLQTRDEAASRQTFIKNGVGWAANDAPRASRLAARLRDDSRLSADDFGLAAYLIERYRVQLCWMANKKGSGLHEPEVPHSSCRASPKGGFVPGIFRDLRRKRCSTGTRVKAG